MTNGLNEKRVQWLTYLVYFLLAVLTFVTGLNSYTVRAHDTKLQNLPSEFVRLERYGCDIKRVETQLERLNDKMDRFLERQSEKGTP